MQRSRLQYTAPHYTAQYCEQKTCFYRFFLRFRPLEKNTFLAVLFTISATSASLGAKRRESLWARFFGAKRRKIFWTTFSRRGAWKKPGVSFSSRTPLVDDYQNIIALYSTSLKKIFVLLLLRELTGPTVLMLRSIPNAVAPIRCPWRSEFWALSPSARGRLRRSTQWRTSRTARHSSSRWTMPNRRISD